MRILAVLLLSLTSLFGRIGETLDQCTARYGKAKLLGSSSYVFEHSHIEAQIFEDVCVEITFSLDGKEQITLEDVQRILVENSGKSQWEVSDLKNGTFWETQDGRFEAIFESSGNFLTIVDRTGSKARIEAYKKKDRAFQRRFVLFSRVIVFGFIAFVVFSVLVNRVRSIIEAKRQTFN